MAFGQGVGAVSVRFGSAVGDETAAPKAPVVAAAAVVGIAVGRGVLAFVDGAAVVATERGVVARTVGDVVGLEICVTAFGTAEEDVSADRPATVGRAVCDAGEEAALTIWDVPPVGAGVAAWAAQRQRPTMAKRRRTDFMNSLTVHLPWGRVEAAESVPPHYHSGSCIPAINALAKGNGHRSKRERNGHRSENERESSCLSLGHGLPVRCPAFAARIEAGCVFK